jgi:hypothetical protein
MLSQLGKGRGQRHLENSCILKTTDPPCSDEQLCNLGTSACPPPAADKEVLVASYVCCRTRCKLGCHRGLTVSGSPRRSSSNAPSRLDRRINFGSPQENRTLHCRQAARGGRIGYYLTALRHPAASASSGVQNQRLPPPASILTFA